jgi:uncharacterized protein YggE
MRLVIAMAAVAVAAAVPAASQPVATLAPGEALLSVEAEGRAASRPDTMTINAGTVTTGATAAEAVAANNALAQRLIAAVRAGGIEARDVRTSHFEVRPSFENEREARGEGGRPPRILGYVVTNALQIRLRNLDNVPSLISRLFEAGANSVNGPRFSLADDRAARRAAERNAIEEARAEAENYAAAIGRRVGRLLRVSDRRTWTEPMTSDGIMITGSRIPATPIEPGEIETRAIVFVDFALAPQ